MMNWNFKFLFNSPLGQKEERMFETHKLNETGFQEVKLLKETLHSAVQTALDLMPEGREKSVFKTKIEEAVFFGTKAVASKIGNWTEIVRYGDEQSSVAPQAN